MDLDKVKQLVALWGGFATSVFLFLGTLGVSFSWLNEATIAAFGVVLVSFGAFAINLYGIWKNTYLVTEKAKEQEKALKKEGLK